MRPTRRSQLATVTGAARARSVGRVLEKVRPTAQGEAEALTPRVGWLGPRTINLRFRHPMRPNAPTLEERFWAKVNKAGPLSAECASRCWVWRSSLTAGYGQLGVGLRPMKAHVVSWAIAHGGDLPTDGLFVCHHCDNRACVNPAHLFLGTALDNTRDAVMKGRVIGKGRPVLPAERGSGRARNGRIGPLSEWLRLAGIPEMHLARALGVSRQAVNWWTLGTTVPTEEMAAAIEEFSFGAVPASSWSRTARPRRPLGLSDEVKAMLAEIAECKQRVRQLRASIKIATRARRVAA